MVALWPYLPTVRILTTTLLSTAKVLHNAQGYLLLWHLCFITWLSAKIREKPECRCYFSCFHIFLWWWALRIFSSNFLQIITWKNFFQVWGLIYRRNIWRKIVMKSRDFVVQEPPNFCRISYQIARHVVMLFIFKPKYVWVLHHRVYTSKEYGHFSPKHSSNAFQFYAVT